LGARLRIYIIPIMQLRVIWKMAFGPPCLNSTPN